jgi:hypothetical protein
VDKNAFYKKNARDGTQVDIKIDPINCGLVSEI